ncbi:hypothetical protein [Brevundimonas sp. GW460-12-10-14-LB2]|uniref:hypothetical protein n=1 Tax=Brevundimonas sp. GW460-12-10-14-LB2 TaxID=1827469 RepID=UPI0012E8E387|nr:hypothetical protein [Brevundimonas sp. GW460-12-10-14-LB2]
MIPAQCEVDWGAWATLFTGCAAVLAALIVGLKQSRIQELQAKIADRVASTEEARIRLELFEKRYAFVVVLNRFVSRVRSKKDFWTEEDTAFLEESKRAQYLISTRNEGDHRPPLVSRSGLSGHIRYADQSDTRRKR